MANLVTEMHPVFLSAAAVYNRDLQAANTLGFDLDSWDIQRRWPVPLEFIARKLVFNLL